jgi:hypothetical protein
MMVPTSYPDAEIRGRLRIWKAQVAQHYTAMNRHLNRSTQPIIFDFVMKNGLGRKRAFDKLTRRFGPGLTLEGLRLDGANPIAVWSVLKVVIGPIPDQHAVSVNYLLTGRLVNGKAGWAEGLWTLGVSDHALGRIVERAGNGVDIKAVIMAAHHNLLQLRSDMKVDMGQFLVRAGAGAFIFELYTTKPIDAKGNTRTFPGLAFYARTWISDEMMSNNQVPVIPDGEVGERLGDRHLLPYAIRELIEEGQDITGLPEMLASKR